MLPPLCGNTVESNHWVQYDGTGEAEVGVVRARMKRGRMRIEIREEPKLDILSST